MDFDLIGYDFHLVGLISVIYLLKKVAATFKQYCFFISSNKVLKAFELNKKTDQKGLRKVELKGSWRESFFANDLTVF